MYNNWLQKLTESYVSSKVELTEAEVILEELKETKEYVLVLEYIIEELMNNDIINEEVVFAVLQEKTDRTAAHLAGVYNRYVMRNKGDGRKLTAAFKNAGKRGDGKIDPEVAIDDVAGDSDKYHPDVSNMENQGRDYIRGGVADAKKHIASRKK